MRRGPSKTNCVLGIDKPGGMTSHDVVARVRRALGERRVGHAGTLDPAATGVLVVGVGQGTRLLSLLVADRKGYDATIEFGTQTSTDDAEGDVVLSADVPPELADPGFARGALAALVGRRSQVPPAYSAISVGGRRAYDMARAGEEVELKAREVTIFGARLDSVESTGPVRWHCHLEVSKGTYVRSIARDLGRGLGSAAHLCALRRTSSGGVSLADCLSLDELERRGTSALAGRMLDPVGLLGASALFMDEATALAAAQGRRLSAPEWVGRGERICLLGRDGLLGVWHRDGSFLRCDVNFPQAIGGVRQ